MSAWDDAEKAANDAGGDTGRFLQLKDDGDKARVVFRGEPQFEHVSWDGSKYVPYDSAKHETKSTRFKMNLYNVDADRGQQWDMSPKTFKALVKVKSKFGLDKVYEIERSGKKGDTKTAYSILPDSEVGADLKAKIDNTPLMDLTGKPEAVSREDMEKLVGALSDEKRVAWLKAFGVGLVRELPDDKVGQGAAVARDLLAGGDGVPF